MLGKRIVGVFRIAVGQIALWAVLVGGSSTIAATAARADITYDYMGAAFNVAGCQSITIPEGVAGCLSGNIAATATFDVSSGFTGQAAPLSLTASVPGITLNYPDPSGMTSYGFPSPFRFVNGNIVSWSFGLSTNADSGMSSGWGPSGGLDVGKVCLAGDCNTALTFLYGYNNQEAGTWTLAGTSPPSSSCVADIKGATFNPVASGSEMEATIIFSGGLSQAETDCGVTNFNWQQKFDVLPSHNPFYPSQTPSIVATAPPSFVDPVPGGWDTTSRTITCANGKTFTSAPANGEDSNPFYWGPTELAGHETTTTLSFLDRATDRCLSGLPWTGPLTSGDFIEFTTTLVGMDGGNLVTLPATYTWDWVTTFDGTAGEADVLKNIMPVDIGSGTGGTAVISINGVSVSAVPEPRSIAFFVTALMLLCALKVKKSDRIGEA